MPELSPFRAVRYTARAGPASDLLAPPYDVIDPRQARELRERSPHNAIHLVLPEPPGAEGHAEAARTLSAWLEEDVLREDPGEAAYVYRQSFAVGGALRDRRCLIAALGLTPFDRGGVLPHEETHTGPKEDRIGLTLATRAQLSPVFLTAADEERGLVPALARAEASGEPVLEAETPDGIAHRLVRIEAEEGDDVCRRAGSEPLLIADGHHRYETALVVAQRRPEDARARRVLACVASEHDPGLLVFPTHRTLRVEPPPEGWPDALEERFELERLSEDSGADRGGGTAGPRARAAARRASEAGPGHLALLEGTGEGWLLRPRPSALAEAGISGEEARIASVAFDRLVLRPVLRLGPDAAAREGRLVYHRDPVAAVEAAGPRGAVFFLAGLHPADVRAVAARGVRLPPKTTYFAPKIPSGLLFRRLSGAPAARPTVA